MASSLPILVVATTNRPNSLTATVSHYYMELLQSAKVSCSLLSLTDLPHDFTHSALYANKGQNKAFNELARMMDIYHKYLFVVPQYNGSFPGVFKAFIDGYAEANIFAEKKCALVGVSRGHQGAIMGLSHLSDFLQYLGMTIYPMQPKLANMPAEDRDTLMNKPGYLSLLKKQAAGFIQF